MIELPIDSFLPQVLSKLREARSLVLVAPPGAGKTTRLPPAIFRGGLLSRENPNLVMLQPRRIAARAAAQRIGEENDWAVGNEVGYHIRFEKKIGPKTRIRVVTEGILTRQLLDDPSLPGVGAVILDEFHERSIHADVALALLREVQQSVRNDLLLIVMSATLEAEPVARYLGNCPIVEVPGRLFPVAVSHDAMSGAALEERVARAVDQVLNDPGNVLIFLPGAEEIRRAAKQLESLAQRNDLLVLPLHGSLSFEDQLKALRPATTRKIILATNIAETSLTIDGVRTVIDSGLARVAGFDAQRGLDRLELGRISRASATQRCGRAGRTAPGQCIRLWSAKEHEALDAFELPEIRRVDLAATVLSLHAWGVRDPRSFNWFEAPSEASLVAAERLLTLLGALNGEGAITPLGKKLAEFPVHPRLARLLHAAAEAGMSQQGADLAALLSEKDILLRAADARTARPQVKARSDLLIRLDLLEEARRHRFAAHLRDEDIDVAAARQVDRIGEQLLRIAGKSQRPQAKDEQTLLKLILHAYPDRVCRRRSSDLMSAAMVGGGGVRLSPESAVRDAEFFIVVDARQDERNTRRESFVRIASAIELQWLEEIFPALMRREKAVLLRDGRVAGVTQSWFVDLLLAEDADSAVDPQHAAQVLAAEIRPRAAEIFANDPAAANFLARVALLRQWMPDHPWPKFDQAELGELVPQACYGKRSIIEVEKSPLAVLLQGQLPFPLDRLLDEQAPAAITLPSGRQAPLAYALDKPPVLAARLQELFGLHDTPRIAGSKVAVVLHLLAPNFRPVQITDDLRGFWSGMYFQVRKDLRARYPKHSWPDDPISATPHRVGQRSRA